MIKLSAPDWAGVALIVCVFLWCVLICGEPDLLTAIIERVMP